MNNNLLETIVQTLFSETNGDFRHSTIILPDNFSQRYLIQKFAEENINSSTPIYIPKIFTLQDYIKNQVPQKNDTKIQSIINLYNYFKTLQPHDITFFEFHPSANKIFETFKFIAKNDIDVHSITANEFNSSDCIDLQIFTSLYSIYCENYTELFSNSYYHDIFEFIKNHQKELKRQEGQLFIVINQKLSPIELRLIKLIRNQFSKIIIISEDNVCDMNYHFSGIVDENCQLKIVRSVIDKEIQLFEIPCNNTIQQYSNLSKILEREDLDFGKILILLENVDHIQLLMSSKVFNNSSFSFNFAISIKDSFAYKLIFSLLDFFYKYNCSNNYTILKSDIKDILINPILKCHFEKFSEKHFVDTSFLYIDFEKTIDNKLSELLAINEQTLEKKLFCSISIVLELSKNYISDFEKASLDLCLQKIIEFQDAILQEGTYSEKIEFVKAIISELKVKIEKKSSRPYLDISTYDNISIIDYDSIYCIEFQENSFPKKKKNNTLLKSEFFKKFSCEVEIQKVKFQRLISRATRAYFFYNSEKTEISRFGQSFLLKKETKHERIFSLPNNRAPSTRDIIIEKDSDVWQKLQKFNTISNLNANLVSPTMLNTYIDCSLKFYFAYVEKLKSHPYNLENSINRQLGIDLHEVCKEVYSRIFDNSENLISEEAIRKFIPKVEEKVYNFLQTKYVNNYDTTLKGELEISRLLITKFIRNLLNLDLKSTPFTILSMENKQYLENFAISIFSQNNKYAVKLTGTIDRIDAHQDTIKIVDYKTGKLNNKILSISHLFDTESKSRSKDALQILIYSYIVYKGLNNSKTKIIPQLVYLQSLLSESKADFSIKIKKDIKYEEIYDIAPYIKEIEEGISKTLSEIFDQNIPFKQTKHTDKCLNCQFLTICNKK